MRLAVTTREELEDGNKRLDASFRASTGVKALHLIHLWAGTAKTSKTNVRRLRDESLHSYGVRRLDALSEVCEPGGIFIPGRFKRNYVDAPAYGERWLSPSDMQRADLTGLRMVSKRLTSSQDTLRISKDYILLSRSGTIGNLVHAREDMDGLIGSDDIIRIVADAKKITSGYLYTYLSSALGKALIGQKTYGAVVPHIEAHHVMDLPVPRLELAIENTIHSLIEQSAALRSEANALLESAREEFLKAANLVPLTKADYYYYGNTREDRGPGCFVVSSLKLSTTTINAWNYGDKFESLRQRIAAHGIVLPLSELLVTGGYYTGGWYKRTRTLPGRGRELISQKQLFGVRKDGEWISSAPITDIGAEQVTEGMILIAGVGTMGESEVFGRCEFVHKNFENKLVVAEVIRVVADKAQIDPGYLYAFLSSDYGFRLLRSTISGTKLCRFIAPLVLSIPVPILPRDKQQEIGDRVRHAYDNRAIATEREDQAQALLAQELGLPPELQDRAAN